MAEAVIYSNKSKTNKDRLASVYSIIEQMRLLHNIEGAKSDGGPEWIAYKKKFYECYRPLLFEQVKLRKAIQDANPDFRQWDNLSRVQQNDLFISAFGDKTVLKEIPTESTSGLLDKLKTIKLSKDKADFSDPYEDFTTFTLADPSAKLTVAANQITYTDIDRRDFIWCYKDSGAGHFGAAFSHYFDWEPTAGAIACAGNRVYGVCNSTAPIISTDQQIACWHSPTNHAGVKPDFYLGIRDGVDVGSDFYTAAYGTRYYNHVQRAANLTCDMYSNAIHTILVDTLTTLAGTSTFRYLHTIYCTGDAAGDWNVSGVIYNYDLQEAAAVVINNVNLISNVLAI